jgi:hypothetical protein
MSIKLSCLSPKALSTAYVIVRDAKKDGVLHDSIVKRLESEEMADSVIRELESRKFIERKGEAYFPTKLLLGNYRVMNALI